MSSSDFRLPDDFPDMTLPEPAAKPPPPWTPASESIVPAAPAGWRVGARVLAPWEPVCMYAGSIKQIQGGEALIDFDDGDSGWVLLQHLQALTVPMHGKLLCRRRMGPMFAWAEVVEARGDDLHVRFEDGSDEWTKVAALRIPCEPLSRGAAPTSVASHRAFIEHLQAGEVVWAPWMNGVLFTGVIDQLQGDEVHIHFDDGDRGWVRRDTVLPLALTVGLRVMARWKMGSQYYPGTITEIDGERVHIHYDDGDREWTRTKALALPGDPATPNARPTRQGMHINWLGWLLPVAIGVVLVFIRAGCR